MSELVVLQAIRLKGRVSAADVAATVNLDPTDIAPTLAELLEKGLLLEGKGSIRITPEGRERLAALLADERSHLDQDALAGSYADFLSVNGDFKALVTDWQIKDGQPNAHDDADYDTSVLARLSGVHERVVPILTGVSGQLPRLAGYADKLSAALAKVEAGETTWLTRPIIDSYHTVWFELHEELIGASGLTREEEAIAGNAQ
ncbi:MarR family transcriptional regulator [Mycobacterium sp. SMC-8]|uniref:MarR family transcriptional regulator n=1 Tax=Mycobacterium sp. SMC-8 TaxID=2857060 RepID=UPI0021B3ABB8|nr:MarR family transcriptional regulator [Mycobacterium sp. SMC-8]UXA11481.1 MarR family transcriptional regulator [Mycobacterium sp. SMC-8]